MTVYIQEDYTNIHNMSNKLVNTSDDESSMSGDWSAALAATCRDKSDASQARPGDADDVIVFRVGG